MRIFSYAEAATRAGLNLRTFMRLMHDGTGPSYVAISTRRRGVLDIDLDRWLLSRRVPAPGDVVDLSEIAGKADA